MDNYEFLDIYLSNPGIYFLALILTAFVYFLFFRRYYTSILDPLFINFLGSVFAGSVVVFLYMVNQINDYYFFSFLLTQFMFMFGFLLTGNKGRITSISSPAKDNSLNSANFELSIFIVCSITFIVLQLVVYKVAGIPLFMDSRLETFTGGSGFGLISRFLDISSIMALYTLISIFVKRKRIPKIALYYTYLFAAFYVTSSILSGAKGSFLTFGFAMFVYIITSGSKNLKKNKLYSLLKKVELKVLLLGIVIAFVVITLSKANGDIEFTEVVGLFGFRLLAYGDVYWFSYPRGTLEYLSGAKPFQALFNDILGLTRLVPWSELPTAIGIDLYQMHHPSNILQGPNARHNVFGYVYFGFIGSIAFSFVLGLVTGLGRKFLFNQQNNTVAKKIFFAILYIKLFGLEYDPMLGLTQLNSLFIVFPIMWFGSILLYETLIRRINIL
jgi:hypothetical protein